MHLNKVGLLQEVRPASGLRSQCVDEGHGVLDDSLRAGEQSVQHSEALVDLVLSVAAAQQVEVHVQEYYLLDDRLPHALSQPPPQSLESSADLVLLIASHQEVLDLLEVQGSDVLQTLNSLEVLHLLVVLTHLLVLLLHLLAILSILETVVELSVDWFSLLIV